MSVEKENLNRKTIVLQGKLLCVYELDDKRNIIYINLVESVIPDSTIKENEELAVYLINKINNTNINMVGYLNI